MKAVVYSLGVVLAFLGYLLFTFRGPIYSESAAGVPPWPVFSIATRVSEFFRTGFLAANPGPLLSLHHGIGYMTPTCMYVVTKLGVPNVLKDGSMDYADLAKAVGAQTDNLFRVIRFLATEGVFKLSGRSVSLTESGKQLRTDQDVSMGWCIIHWNEEAALATHELLHEVTTGEDAFTRANGDEIFATYRKRPKSQEAFTKCMRALAFSNTATMTEYDFSKHRSVLDLGGGMGALTEQMLVQHGREAKPKSQIKKAVVFDLPTVVQHGYVKHPLVEYVGGSFFDLHTIPRGADAIVINGVIHDWSDEESIKILHNAQQVLEPGGRIIVIDAAVPSASHPMHFAVSRLDTFMMMASHGFFRTFTEYEALWAKAGLQLVETRPSRSLNSLWILEKASK